MWSVTAPGLFIDSQMNHTDLFDLAAHGTKLLDHAAQSVRYAVKQGEPLRSDPSAFPPPLLQPGASFVTLKKSGALRGCIGSLEAVEPLVENVASNAHGAVARDTRFPAVTETELEDLSVSLSILSPLSKLSFSDEADLVGQLVPDRDGLVIADNKRRSTFLPQVWEDLADPEAFLSALKRKGGFGKGHPSETMAAWRYTVTDLGPIALDHAS